MNLPSKLAFLTCAAMAAGAARADCAPIIAAYSKAELAGRYAVYNVASMQASPKGRAFHIDVAGVGYTDFGDHWQKGDGSHAAFEASYLKGQEQKGQVRCEAIGDDKIGSEVVVGYQIRKNDKSAADPTAIRMWISRSTGMPVYHT